MNKILSVSAKNMFRVVQRNARVWWKYKIPSLVGNLGQPLLFLLAFGLGLGQQIETIAGLTYLQFIAPGLACSAVMYSASFEATYGSYTRLSTQSTFEGILMTPITVEELAFGEVLWGALKGLLSGLVMIAVMPLFGLWPSPWVACLPPLLFVAGILFAALGLIMTALATNYDFFNYFVSLIITPLFLFSGIFFAVENLPRATMTVVKIMPLTPVVDLARMFCYGTVKSGWLMQIVILVLLAAGASWLAAVLLRRRLIK
ncbi:MAG: ABC transporter permease [Desulfobulbaceae bacterium]|nr:ABC transporter permease [Desulfobulbaceae bacterium]